MLTPVYDFMDQGTPQTPGHQGSAHYHRSGTGYGSADRLAALGDASTQIGKVFLLNVVLAVVINGTSQTIARSNPESLIMLSIIALSIVVLVIGLASYPAMKQLAVAKGWAPSAAITASLLLSLNSAFCCGLLGYLVVGHIISSELTPYGLKSGFFGIKPAIVQAEVARLREQEAVQKPAPSPFVT